MTHKLAGIGLVLGVTIFSPRPGVVNEPPVDADVPPAPLNARAAHGDFDGDGCMDIGLKSHDGTWYIDACHNGYGGAWDAAHFMYGDASVTPVPADYDGDGKTDLAIKDTDGMWAIDYAANGFGAFDARHHGYGHADAVPVPADYDGDGKADLAVKDAGGMWGIDWAGNGFVGWDDQKWGYGGAAWKAVPANYDGDVGPNGKPRADRAVKTNAGEWKIDYSNNGYGGEFCIRDRCFKAQWDVQLAGYGPEDAVPVPADYDQDGYADLAVKDSTHWRIDRRSTGYGAWDEQHRFTGGYLTFAIPGKFNLNPSPFIQWLDLAIHSYATGYSLIDLRSSGIGVWDQQVDNPHRPPVSHPQAPRITATRVRGPDGLQPYQDRHYQLQIGQKYTVEVDIKAGATPDYAGGLAINPALNVPASLRINDRLGGTSHVTITNSHTRRFSIVCSEPGSFPLGFEIRDGVSYANPDHGVRVSCRGPGPGIIRGRVTRRACLPSPSAGCGRPGHRDAHYSVGTEPGLEPIPGATIAIVGAGVSTVRMADSSGRWSATVPVDVPLTVSIARPGFSETMAFNVRVPGGASGGLELDTPLEESFAALTAKGMRYTTYLDYSRGRTLIHVVRMTTSSATLKSIQSTVVSSNPVKLKALVHTAQELGPDWPVVMNAGLFEDLPLTGTPIGYLYSEDHASSGYVRSLVPAECDLGFPCTKNLVPMLTVRGTGLNQRVRIVWDSERDFLTTSSQWNQVDGVPLWDNAPRDRASDVSYALQCGNQDPLYRADTGAIAEEAHPEWASTAIGISGSTVYLVVVDGEGIWGGNGASGHQLGLFFRDKLRAEAMLFDSGISTELVLWGGNGARRVNTLTGEDQAYDIDPYRHVVASDAGVGNYLKAGAQP